MSFYETVTGFIRYRTLAFLEAAVGRLQTGGWLDDRQRWRADGRVRAAIGRASDFYGPGVTTSIVGVQVFEKVVDGGTVWFPGNPDVPHTYTYISDFARALVMLGEYERALGDVWHVPSARTLTTRQFVTLAGDVAGTNPTVRSLPSWLVRLVGVVSQTLSQLVDTQYQRSKPFVVDSTKFEQSFDFRPTPHREALEQTVSWSRLLTGVGQ